MRILRALYANSPHVLSGFSIPRLYDSHVMSGFPALEARIHYMYLQSYKIRLPEIWIKHAVGSAILPYKQIRDKRAEFAKDPCVRIPMTPSIRFNRA